MANKPEKILYLSSTHWDREWYKPFQSFRFRLIETLNTVIDVLENDSKFKTFTLDGQTVMLDDFSVIEPKRAQQLRNLISEGRIVVGPWYTMPDEFLVSGESLIRNLLDGHKTALEYGAADAMKYGYICDMFGHIAQMPQIFNGFEIQGALLGRGTNNQSCESHFIWKAPDGSQCMTFKVPESCGYGTFWFEVLFDYLSGKDPDKQNIIKRACTYIDLELERSPVPYVFLMDGMDHENIHDLAPWICSELEKIYQCPVVIDSPYTVLAEIKAYEDKMPIKTGELIETAKELTEHNKLITNTLSSRYDIKKANDNCQNLFEKCVSPLMATANIKGHTVQKTYYDLAYQYLLKNHAHDSICGCSIDEVHKDMHYRFNQALTIGNELVDYAATSLFDIREGDKDTYTIKLTVCNPSPYQLHDAVVVKIYFPPNYPQKLDEQIPSEKINNFKIFNSDGKEIIYSILSITNNSYKSIPKGFYSADADIYEVSIVVDIPASSASDYLVIPSETPVRYFDSLCTDDCCCENDYITLTINENGTINIKDKQTSAEYNNLLSFIDSSEAGDGWFHYAPVTDSTIYSKNCKTTIEKIHDGPDYCAHRITTYMDIPSKIDYNRNYTRSSAELTVLKISSIVVLTRTGKWVEITTKVENNAFDHQLKLSIKTGINSNSYYANQAFAFVERKTGIDKSTNNWKEPEKAEKAFENIVCKKDQVGNGIAFISKHGLHECAALDDKSGTLNITLFRSFSKIFLTGNQSDGQLNMPLEFNYRLMPISNDISFADIIKSKDFFTAGIQSYCTCVKDDYKLVKHPTGFSLSGKNVALSIIKVPENQAVGEIIVRLVNYSGKSTEAQLICSLDIEKAYITNMLEKTQNTTDFCEKTLNCVFNPYEIKTYRICF
jgi:mannosylglycerate hydrolase